MQKSPFPHAFWHIDVVTPSSIDQALAFLRDADPDLRGSLTRPTAGEAYARAGDTKSRPLVSRCWMWLAACSGHSGAMRAVAEYLESDARCATDPSVRNRLASLAMDWHSKGSNMADASLSHPREPVVHEDIDDAPVEEGIVVVGPIGDASSREGAEITKRYASIANRPLPVKGRVPAPGELAEGILSRWPWAIEAASTVERHFAVIRAARGAVVKLPPMLFVGPKGSGKSSLAEWLCRKVELGFTTLPCGGVADAAGIAAVTRSWTTTRPGAVPQAMATHGVANPAIVFDEIDKTTMAGSQNGSVSAALLSLIGASEAYDSCLMTKVDVSKVSFLATANDISRVDAPLLDRFRIVTVPAPSREHAPALLRVSREEFVRSTGVPEDRVPHLSRKDVALITDWFVRNGGSARNFYALYERVVSGLIMARESREAERGVSDAPSISPRQTLH